MAFYSRLFVGFGRLHKCINFSTANIVEYRDGTPENNVI